MQMTNVVTHVGQQGTEPITTVWQASHHGAAAAHEGPPMPLQHCREVVVVHLHCALVSSMHAAKTAVPPSAAGRLPPRSPAPSPRCRAAQRRSLPQHLLTVPMPATLCVHGGEHDCCLVHQVPAADADASRPLAWSRWDETRPQTLRGPAWPVMGSLSAAPASQSMRAEVRQASRPRTAVCTDLIGFAFHLADLSSHI